MAKKLAKIQEKVDSKNILFFEYLKCNASSEINAFISELALHTNIYVFSGIIRDFFIFRDNSLFRDIDLIIEDDIVIEKLFSNLIFKRNSFGGYKIKFDKTSVDLWVIKKTWALNRGQLNFEFNYVNELPSTTFFNFSSIIYSLNEKRFIIGVDFLRFLRDKKIDIVLKENPYPELCIVNSLYYSDKLKLELGNKLKMYLIENFNLCKEKVEPIQSKHFGQILYPIPVIEKRLASI